MKRTLPMLAVTLATGIALGAIGNGALNAQQTPIKRTMLQEKDIEGMPGKEAIMYVAELAPGAASGRHFHPGPELAYVLQGTLVLEPDGHPAMTLKAGESLHNPAKHIHNAKNPSTGEPTKVVVFLIGEKGQPLATPVQ